MAFDFLFSDAAPEFGEPNPLTADLRLKVLTEAMSQGDGRIADVCLRVLLHPLTRADSIAARRDVLADADAHFGLFGEWLAAARGALERADRYAEFQNPSYDRIISNQKKLITEAEVAGVYLAGFRRISAAARKERAAFRSEAVRRFLADVSRRYSDENLTRIETKLDQIDSLKQSDSLTLTASVGKGLKPENTCLNGLSAQREGSRLHAGKKEIVIPLSNIALVQNTEEMVQSAVLPLYRTVAAFNRSSRAYLEKLSFQASFYVGCVNLKKKLLSLNVPTCTPSLSADGSFTWEGLAEPGLALLRSAAPVGNDACFTNKRLVLITGANQGGKTTFLRSVGLAQIMAQSGMFVAARQYACPVFSGIFSHFPSGEDVNQEMGMLDVELRRLSQTVDRLRPHGLLLMNESFQTTMPSDAKYLAETIVQALTDAGTTVVFVTHLYAYASALYAKRPAGVLWLRARREAGQPAYVLREGEPCASASGTELYEQVLESQDAKQPNRVL